MTVLTIPVIGARVINNIRVMPNGVVEGDIEGGSPAILRVRPNGFQVSRQFDQLIIDRWGGGIVVRPLIGPTHRKFMNMVPAISGAFGHYQLTNDGGWKKVLPEALLKGCEVIDVGGSGLHNIKTPTSYIVDTQASWAEIVYPSFVPERSIYKLLDQGYPNSVMFAKTASSEAELRNIMQEVLDK